MDPSDPHVAQALLQMQMLQQQQQQQLQMQQQLMMQQQQSFFQQSQNTNPLGSAPMILCCECGTPMVWNPSNMCVNCIRSRVDISEGIPKQTSVHWCKTCSRYLVPPRQWVVASLESKELLSLCMKRIRGLNKVKLIDASFVWTEPHSRRLKVKLTIQKEVMTSTILQQSFVVDFTVESLQCDQCKRVGTDQSWKAAVQVRQKADHRKTFFFLEQLLLKHNAHSQCSNIKETSDGMDFYFQHRSHALKFIEFLGNVVPIKKGGQSERLLSADNKSNTANTKLNFSVEIAPICKDDIICLTPQQYRESGGMGPLLVCTHVSAGLRFMDPSTLRTLDITSYAYWKRPFQPLCTNRNKTEFFILDTDRRPDVQHGRFCLGEAEVARACDFGVNDTTYRINSHLGNIFRTGDTAYGYDVRHLNLNDSSMDMFAAKLDLPEIILIGKCYPPRRKKRAWKLKTLGAIEADDEESVAAAAEKSRVKKGERDLAEKRRIEYESFLSQLEEDPELRSRINIYRDRKVNIDDEDEEEDGEDAAMVDEGEDDPQDRPEVGLEEMLDDITIASEGPDDEYEEEMEDSGDEEEEGAH